MLHWLDAHAPAVQAFASVAILIASVILAILTAFYVRLTKSIADSSVEQVRMLRESLTDARARTRDSLRAHCQRLQKSIAVLYDKGPDLAQLHDFALIKEQDVVILESLAKEHGGGVQHKAAAAATGIRHLLGWQARAAKIKPIFGWNLTPLEVHEYVLARNDALSQLAAVDTDAAARQ